jgi:hypothetical protein
MSDFGARLRNNLEPVLAMVDTREKISAYHDMPYAIFHYDPEHELALRGEVSSLQTRLENRGKRITRISLAACCPSSGDLRHMAGFRKGGSGSSVVEIMRHAVDVANDDWRWSGV